MIVMRDQPVSVEERHIAQLTTRLVFIAHHDRDVGGREKFMYPIFPPSRPRTKQSVSPPSLWR